MRQKKKFNLSDTVVLGVLNKKDPDGVFNPETLNRIYELTQFAKTLQWPGENNPEKMSGVIEAEMINSIFPDFLLPKAPSVLRCSPR